MNKKSLWQITKYVFFSISAGLIQVSSFAIFNELCKFNYWLAYILSLSLSIIWNLTLNRRFTFKSATNVPIAMLKTFAFYLVFTPISTYLGDVADKAGINEYLILAVTMLSNYILEFLFYKFFVFRNQENTLKQKNDTSVWGVI